MKSVMLSIRPEWCAMIARREKTAEVRKTRPKQNTPFKAYIYCTKGGRPLVYGDVFRGDWDMDYVLTYGWSREEADRLWGVMNGKVIGEFTCDSIEKHWLNSAGCRNLSEYSRVPADELHIYAQPNDWLYGWNISALEIYDKPRYLAEFGLTRPPQSWCYVEEDQWPA